MSGQDKIRTILFLSVLLSIFVCGAWFLDYVRLREMSKITEVYKIVERDRRENKAEMLSNIVAKLEHIDHEVDAIVITSTNDAANLLKLVEEM